MREDPVRAGDARHHMTCRSIVKTLIEKYEWALLQEEELVELVLGSVQPGVPQTKLEKEAKHHYTIVLHEACRQAEDPDRRERGYYELSRFLFRAAWNRWPDLAEDTTQRALLLVYEQIDRCNSPGTFLAFANYKLLQAFKDEQRARGRDLPLDTTSVEKIRQIRAGRDRPAPKSHSDQQLLPPIIAVRQAAEGLSPLNERLQVLVDAIKCLPDKRMQEAIILKYFGDWSDKEIAERLGIAVGYVRVLRHRGIDALREDECLRDYFKDTNGEEDWE
jgi:RNA polymerase sigma factor (sigma-70 family)